MPDRTVRVAIIMTFDEADTRSIRSVAAEDFGVDDAADMTLADVVCGIVRNTLDAQLVGFGVPITVVAVKADETQG